MKRFNRYKLFGKPEFLVRIVYKSGHVEEHWFHDFHIQKGEGLKEISSTNIHGRPLFFGIDNIESIWQLGARLPLFGG